jgi:hypothetical protein
MISLVPDDGFEPRPTVYKTFRIGKQGKTPENIGSRPKAKNGPKTVAATAFFGYPMEHGLTPIDPAGPLARR